MQNWQTPLLWPTGKTLDLQNATWSLHHVKYQMVEFVTFAKNRFT